MAIAISLLFGILFPYLFSRPINIIPWIVSAIFLITSYLLPILLLPVYNIWIRLGAVLGWINTKIILSAVFYLLITPIGILLSILRKKPLNKKQERPDSYRIRSKKRSNEHMEKPY